LSAIFPQQLTTHNSKLLNLFLIPVPIAENALHTVPPYAQEIARGLEVFLVERAKTARHFIKSLHPPRPIQEMIFEELPEREGAPSDAERVFLDAVRVGKDVGLLSEAGCPGVADPGAGIVALAHRQGVRVVPLVGPSSLLLALMASGMNGQRFAFHGYLSPKRPELARDLRRLEQLARQHDQTQLFIETPYRSQMVLQVALETLQPDTVFGVAQDLTGAAEQVRSLPVRMWKQMGAKVLEKAPAVFLIGK
jgi:16S rRNA (cytidine1402-2'-O)-methyltransferase